MPVCCCARIPASDSATVKKSSPVPEAKTTIVVLENACSSPPSLSARRLLWGFCHRMRHTLR